jgi:hypothetical protein
MALSLSALTRVGFATAKKVAPDAFKAATVRLGPESTVDPSTEAKSTEWDVEVETSLFGYDDAEERKVLPLSLRQRTFLLEASDYPADAPFRQTGEVDIEGETWDIYRAEVAPGGSVVILFGQCPQTTTT